MTKHNQANDITKYVIGGIVVGSAIGTAVTVMMKQKKHPTGMAMMREKTANALDTIGTIMQNIADYTR